MNAADRTMVHTALRRIARTARAGVGKQQEAALVSTLLVILGEAGEASNAINDARERDRIAERERRLRITAHKTLTALAKSAGGSR